MGMSLKTCGRACESLVLASQTLVLLMKVPNGVQWLPGGKTVPKRGPCDFVGIVRATGRMVVLDAKECAIETRFPMNTIQVPEHQQEQLRRFGECGALAGLLIEATATARLHWLPWQMLISAPPSYEWAQIPDIGPSSKLVDWTKVFAADGERREGGGA